jgi:hypothetical protein
MTMRSLRVVRRKRIYIPLLLVLSLLLCGAYLRWWAGEPELRAYCDRVVGKSLAEIEADLWPTRFTAFQAVDARSSRVRLSTARWARTFDFADIQFDASGVAVGAQYSERSTGDIFRYLWAKLFGKRAPF